MKATVLVGTGEDRAGALANSLTRHLEGNGWSVRTYRLSEMAIPPCGGEFNCWLKTPGICSMSGPHQEIIASAAQSGLFVVVTPVTWGGYSYDLKKMMDHILPVISPFMESYEGETHHVRRYAQSPDFLTVGLLQQPDRDQERLFAALVRRNALNWQSRGYDLRFVYQDSSPEDASEETASWFPLRHDTPPSARTSLDGFLAPQAGLPVSPPRKALLLTGSPNGWKGHSGMLGNFVADRLKARGIEVERASAYSSFNSESRMAELVKAAMSADLLALTTPLYVDQLPAPVIRVLEGIARAPGDGPERRSHRFAALVNSGFPEPTHNETALAICNRFAVMNGWEWAGGVGIPGGGMLEGKSLEAAGGKVRNVKRALELATDALARGETIPSEAVAVGRQISVPPWLYRLFGNLGFRWTGRGKRLRARPYEPQQE